MSVFVWSSVVVTLVWVAGVATATLVAGIPLPILACAAVGGRYAGLVAGERSSQAGPTSGCRIRAAVAAAA